VHAAAREGDGHGIERAMDNLLYDDLRADDIIYKICCIKNWQFYVLHVLYYK
jgi:hypothetical protein